MTTNPGNLERASLSETQTNVCFNCGGPVPEFTDSGMGFVVFCKSCTPLVKRKWEQTIKDFGEDWRSARAKVVTDISNYQLRAYV